MIDSWDWLVKNLYWQELERTKVIESDPQGNMKNAFLVNFTWPYFADSYNDNVTVA